VLVVYSLSRLANPDISLGGLNFVPREMSRALSDKSIDDVTQLDEEIAKSRTPRRPEISERSVLGNNRRIRRVGGAGAVGRRRGSEDRNT